MIPGKKLASPDYQDTHYQGLTPLWSPVYLLHAIASVSQPRSFLQLTRSVTCYPDIYRRPVHTNIGLLHLAWSHIFYPSNTLDTLTLWHDSPVELKMLTNPTASKANLTTIWKKKQLTNVIQMVSTHKRHTNATFEPRNCLSGSCTIDYKKTLKLSKALS